MSILSKHLPFARLADLVEGRSASDERAESLQHVSQCSKCRAKLTDLESLLGLMREDAAEDAPPHLVINAIRLFRARAKRERCLFAVLKFDSFQMSPAYGVRSPRTGARQLLYSAGDYDIDLRVTPESETWIVSGQVFGDDCTGGRIELEGATGLSQSALNDQCEFTLPPVPSGSYNFRLCLSNTEVEIPQLDLRS